MPPGSASAFEPRRDVDPVAKDVVVLDDDVAEVNADAELDPAVRGAAALRSAIAALHLDRAAHRIDDAGEFHQQAVAGGLDDAATVFGDLGIDQLAPVRFQPCERPFLVRTHQPRVAGHIGGEDRGQPAFDAFPSQSGDPLPARAK